MKWCPAFGSTIPKMLAVPQRWYSLSRFATWPGRAGRGGRTIFFSRTRRVDLTAADKKALRTLVTELGARMTPARRSLEQLLVESMREAVQIETGALQPAPRHRRTAADTNVNPPPKYGRPGPAHFAIGWDCRSHYSRRH